MPPMPTDRADLHELPTPRTTLSAGYVCVLVWCKGGCQHQAPADLQALVDAGRGDVPLMQLRFRCGNCGSRRTDWAATAKETGPRMGLS